MPVVRTLVPRPAEDVVGEGIVDRNHHETPDPTVPAAPEEVAATGIPRDRRLHRIDRPAIVHSQEGERVVDIEGGEVELDDPATLSPTEPKSHLLALSL